MNKPAKVLSIVIPTLYQGNYYNEILKNLDELWRGKKNEEVEIITIENTLVNEAWNKWVEQATGKYILIINDDIVIYEKTIERLMQLLDYCIISCPYFTQKEDFNLLSTHNRDNLCWFCYMFKVEDKDKLFPIPSDLKLWFWDNWLFYKAEKNLSWGWRIHHRESKTICAEDKKEYYKRITERDEYAWHSFYKLIV
jgi:glycosyltransferase involved in cell wall biosynthesis